MPTEKVERKVVQSTDHGRLYNDGTILLLGVRVSYPHWAKPYVGKNDKGEETAKYSITCLLPKGPEYNPTMRLMSNEINRILKEQKVAAIKADNKFLRNGDESGKEEAMGHWTVSASESRRPVARGFRKDPKTGKPVKLDPVKDAEEIYGGCWCNVLIRPWWMNNGYGKKVNAGFSAIQRIPTPSGMDDEAFGQGRIGEDEIDESLEEFMNDDDSGYDDSLDDDEEL